MPPTFDAKRFTSLAGTVVPWSMTGSDGTRTRDLRRDSWAAGVAVDRSR